MLSWIENLVEWIASFDPEFRKAIRSANAQEINQLAGLIGTQLPRVYTEYLEVAGSSDGGLFLVLRAYTNIEGMIKYYRALKADFPDLAFDSCIPFATGDVFEGLGFDMKTEIENPSIVLLQDGQAGSYFSSSLPVMAYQHAFLFERAAKGQTARFDSFSGVLTLDDARSLFSGMRFEDQWFSDNSLFCARREQFLVTAHMGGPGGRLEINIGGAEKGDVVHIGRQITNVLGGDFQGWTKEPTLKETRGPFTGEPPG